MEIEYLTVLDVAVLKCVCAETVRRAIQDGKLSPDATHGNGVSKLFSLENESLKLWVPNKVGWKKGRPRK